MICVICGYEILGFGNNALPVKVGQCCGTCNETVVIPRRLANVFEMQTQENKNDQEEK